MEFDASIRMFLLRQVIVVALGFDPYRIGFERGFRQLESPSRDRSPAVGRGGPDQGGDDDDPDAPAVFDQDLG